MVGPKRRYSSDIVTSISSFSVRVLDAIMAWLIWIS